MRGPLGEARRLPELMAPAGDEEALRAAIRSGADAVYFGVQDWNARVRARNFPLEGIAETIASIHQDGVRAYVTFNTLVLGSEERAAHAALERIHDAGPDALIVQDLGVAQWVHERFPSLPLHASTQMTIASAPAIDFLRRFGVERVILARELTLPEIGRIRREIGENVELEVFVHGAICVSYSGQCLSSEAWGGRSANRGQCAQACRLPYDLIVDGAPRDLGDQAYLLSPRDLEGYRRIPELVAIGIDGFKIEGRMKSAPYVAAATALYRQALDHLWTDIDVEHTDKLALDARKVFSRGESEGFLGGINHQILVDGRTRAHRGTRIGIVRRADPAFVEVDLDPQAAVPSPGDGLLFASGPHESQETGGKVYAVTPPGPTRTAGVGSRHCRLTFGREAGPDPRKIVAGSEVYITHDRALDLDLRRRIHDPTFEKRTPLSIKVTGTAGTSLAAIYRDAQGHEARVESASPLEAADRHGLDEDAVRAHLGRLGGTRYVLGEVRLVLDQPLALPVREMNAMRREAIEQMERLRSDPIGRIDPARHIDPIRLADPRRRIEGTSSIPKAGRAEGEDASPVIDAIAHADQLEEGSRGGASAGGRGVDDPFIILCRTREQVEAACDAGATRIALDFLSLVGLKEAVAIARRAKAELTLCPPRIQKPGEEKIDDFLLRCRPDAILVRNLGTLDRIAGLPQPRPALIADTTLNAVNRAAVTVLISAGCTRVSPGLDLDNDQLLALASSCKPEEIEIPLHHHLPLFHTEHCVFAAFLSKGADWRSCGRPCDRHAIRLRDRTGQEHAVIADVGCRNTVFGARAQSVLGLLPRLREGGFRHFRLELLEEDGAGTRNLIAAYRGVWEGSRQPAEAIGAIRASTRFGISGASPERLRRPDWKPQGGKRPTTPLERRESMPASSTPRSSTPRRSGPKPRGRRTR